MDTREKIQQNAATIEFAALLMESVKLFTEKSTAFQAAMLLPLNTGTATDIQTMIDLGGDRHLKVAYELGALFNSIIAQLLVLGPRYTAYAPTIFGAADPAPLKWNDNNSYEWRLFKVMCHPEVYNFVRSRIKDLPELHAQIVAGVKHTIAKPGISWNPTIHRGFNTYELPRLTPLPGQKGGTRRRKHVSRRN
jgi:hypothetical protein